MLKLFAVFNMLVHERASRRNEEGLTSRQAEMCSYINGAWPISVSFRISI